MGALMVIGGTAEAAIGAAGILAPEPGTTVGGVMLFFHGADTAATGFRQLWTGEAERTLTSYTLEETAVALGVERETARELAFWGELVLGVGGTYGGSRVFRAQQGAREADDALAAATKNLELPSKIEPVEGTINVGGGLEDLVGSNLNAMLPSGPSRGIPNLVEGHARDIARFFKPKSARQIVSNKLPAHTVDWPAFARGAAQVLKPGGKVSMNVWFQGTRPQFTSWSSAIIATFEAAGFTGVVISGEGSAVRIVATLI